MGRLVVSMFSTLDGVMQGPGGPGEDVEGGFPFSGWQAPFADDESGAVILQQILAQDALLIGRKTYDIWVNRWPQATDAIGEHFNAIPKFVASRTLSEPTWEGTRVLDADLVDAVDLFLFPVVLGTGKRWFREGVLPARFALTAAPRAFAGGSVLLSYERAGSPAFGSMD